MSATTKIEWATKSWNPLVGCTKVSPGCKNCYAMKMAARLAAMGAADIKAARDPGRKGAYMNVVKSEPNGQDFDFLPQWNNKVEMIDAALTDPLHWRKPARVFVNSMSDLFHKDVPFEFIDRVFAVMALCTQHTFQVLTKRPERMAEYLLDDALRTVRIISAMREFIGRGAPWAGKGRASHIENVEYLLPLPNVWLGTSVEDQQQADARIPHLLKCPAAVRFLSVEPLLGPVDLTRVNFANTGAVENVLDCRVSDWAKRCGIEKLSGIDWVIIGGESGPGARPMHPDWARSLRDQCVAADVLFFFKQWGAYGPYDDHSHIADWDDRVVLIVAHDGESATEGKPRRGKWSSPRDGHGNHCAVSARVGKKAAGRLLDGREWNEMPQIGGAV